VKYIHLEEEGDKRQSDISKQEIDTGSELEDNVKELIEENESLRKGMHEILDSIHNQDGIINILYYNICSILIYRTKLCNSYTEC